VDVLRKVQLAWQKAKAALILNIVSLPASYPISGLKHVTLSSDTCIFLGILFYACCIWIFDELRMRDSVTLSKYKQFSEGVSSFPKGPLGLSCTFKKGALLSYVLLLLGYSLLTYTL